MQDEEEEDCELELDDRYTKSLYISIYKYVQFCYSMADAGVDPSTPTGPSRSVSPCPTAAASSRSTATPASPIPQPRSQKRKRVQTREEDLDQALLQDILDSRERRRGKSAETPKNPEVHFGLEIAERLNQMTPRLKAVAKMRIQQVLLEVEFPEPTMPPPSPSQTTGFYSNYQYQ